MTLLILCFKDVFKLINKGTNKMNTVEKIQAVYEKERAELKEQFKKSAINKRLYDSYLQQLNRAEHMDIMDLILEEE